MLGVTIIDNILSSKQEVTKISSRCDRRLKILRLANHNLTIIVDYFPNFEKEFSMVKLSLIESKLIDCICDHE